MKMNKTHCQVEVQEKYFWISFSKYKNNMLKMILNTIELLFIDYSNTFLQKIVFFFPHVRHFTMINGSFQLPE